MITELDFQILDWLQARLRCGFLDLLMPKITVLGDAGWFWIVMSVVLLLIPRTRKIGLACTLALLLDVLLVNGALKHIFMRPRPYALREVQLLIIPPSDTSFPSGHTAASFAAACAVVFSGRRLQDIRKLTLKIGIPSMVLACCIAFSRLYLYVHFPTDVLGGLVCGILCGYLGAALMSRISAGLASRRCKNSSASCNSSQK